MKPLRPARTFSAALTTVLLVALFAARARAQAEAAPAWQVTQFDVTANVPAPGAERTLSARAVVSARNVGGAAGQTFTARLNPAAVVKSTSVNDAPATFTKLSEARTQLQLVRVALPAQVAPGGAVRVAFDYTLPVAANTALAALGSEGAQFLPLSFWYPAPNSPTSPRGADFAPVRVTVNAPAGDAAVSTGQAAGSAFDQKLSAQPFFLTGRWDAVEGANEARGVTAMLPRGATADERRRAEALIGFAAAARAYFAATLGGVADAPLRLVAVSRGAGFDMGGTILVEPAAFRRAKLDATTALTISESVARLWVGGAAAVRGAGAGAVSEGLTRHLALGFIEKQLGAEAAEAERLRERVAFAAIARRDSPLSLLTPFDPNYAALAADKGAMVWRLAEHALGRDAFLAAVRSQLQNSRGEITLASFRAALAGGGGAGLKTLLDAELDQPTQTDLLVGLPQQRAGVWASALRNTGTADAAVTVVAITDRGERVTTEATVKASDFGEAIFKTAARVVSAEVDPEKLYPQLDYSNDEAPRQTAIDAALEEATRALTNQQFAQAEALARSLAARAPLFQDARILLARTLLEGGKLEEAERAFRDAADSPLPLPLTLAWANVGLGEIALRRGRPDEAARLFTEAVRAEGGTPPTLAARAARLRAESALGPGAPAVDESVRTFIAQLDAAIKGGRRAEIDTFVAPGELPNFSKGIAASQPDLWQTKVLRAEPLGGDRVAVDVQITSRALGGDKSGPAVYVLTRAGGRLLLTDIPVFEVR
jgi:tetratricopeptide (TPR) repeat protein